MLETSFQLLTWGFRGVDFEYHIFESYEFMINYLFTFVYYRDINENWNVGVK